MTTVTQTRTFGIGDSAEQSHNIRVQQALGLKRDHRLKVHGLRTFVSYLLTATRTNRLLMQYERTYGPFTPGQPAPFAE